MVRTINKAAVIGSGVMGSAIAALLAGAGFDCLLLDIVPDRMTEKEQLQGLTLQHSRVRNRLARQAIDKLAGLSPPALYDDRFASRITPGNIEDGLRGLSEVDWIIEAVVENLDVKRRLLQKIDAVRSPGTIVSSNTSGISIAGMADGCSADFKRHFIGTHFFNPPRYTKLLELVPGPESSPQVIAMMIRLAENRLGKGVVIAKDTPNFIANRIGTYGLLVTLQEMRRGGYSVEEIDAATGPAMGRPKSATFRTLDLVGLDTFAHVAAHMHEKAVDGAEKQVFVFPDFVHEMITRGWIGEKSGQGFYKKTEVGGVKQIWSIDPVTLDYRPVKKVTSASLEEARTAKGVGQRLQALIGNGDAYSVLAWNTMKPILLYAADKLGEIADSIVDIDKAMRWGFNWELGPFEMWDAIGLRSSAKRMEKEGEILPDWVSQWIASGNESFYANRNRQRFYYSAGRYKSISEPVEHISLSRLKEDGHTIAQNSGASLIDLGDGVACLEFHSPNNAIGPDILTMIRQSVEEVRLNYSGLVIANEGRHFCVGANLMLLLVEAQAGEWEEVDGIIRQFQNTMLTLKYFEKPVVAAPHGMTLGGGVEVCMPADHVCASVETYYGLVETGVGLIPAGGGCKETALRISRMLPGPDAELQPMLNHAFETIGKARTSTSAYDAKRIGLLQEGDAIVMNREHLIHEAKQAALRLVRAGVAKRPAERIRVAGEAGKAVMRLGAYALRQGGYISDHDLLIARKLAHVLAGGSVPAGTLVSEQHMLDLEREAFLSLCGEPLTQQRMQHMLATGKPLRN